MRTPTTAAQTVSVALHDAIVRGELEPGTHLDEVGLCVEYGISRNTLREAFRMLDHQRLVEHRPHRGVFVRRVAEAEAREIFALRRMLEVGSLHEAAARPDGVSAAEIELIRAAVVSAETAAERGHWAEVGTANTQFHLAVTAVGRNSLVDQVAAMAMTSMRLVFLTAGTADEVHRPYVTENRDLFELIAHHDLSRAALHLESYLQRAERHLLST